MKHGPFEDVFPIENGDIPASYVSLPEGISLLFHHHVKLQLEGCSEGRYSVGVRRINGARKPFFLYSSDTNFEEDSSPFRFFGPKNGDLSHPNKITNLKLI